MKAEKDDVVQVVAVHVLLQADVVLRKKVLLPAQLGIVINL